MATIPLHYPAGCTDEQIQSFITESSKEMVSAYEDPTMIVRSNPIISLGEFELQKRIIQGLHSEIQKQSESSKRTERSSWRISVAALILSIVSIGITIYFSHQSDTQNEAWQKTQIDLLQKLIDKPQFPR